LYRRLSVVGHRLSPWTAYSTGTACTYSTDTFSRRDGNENRIINFTLVELVDRVVGFAPKRTVSFLSQSNNRQLEARDSGIIDNDQIVTIG
jgi:hypothetical protein